METKPRFEMNMKQSISRQIRAYMFTLVMLITIGAATLYVVESKVTIDYDQRIELAKQKYNLYVEIQKNVDATTTEVRGYIAFKTPELLNQVKMKEQAVNTLTDQYAKLDLTPYDNEYFKQFKDTKDHFFNEVIPLMIKMTDQDRRAELTKISENQYQYIDDFRTRNGVYTKKLETDTNDLQAEANHTHMWLKIYLLIYLAVVIIAIGYLGLRLARYIGAPMQEIARVTKRNEDDALLQLPYHARKDEIGFLTQSLQEMLRRIRQNERKLIEQNDELQAQQEELISQQEELHNTLNRVQENERILEAQNDLNTSMINTRDRDEMLKNIIYNIATIQDADKGAIVLLEPGYPNGAVGITKEQMKRFLDHFDHGLVERLEDEGKSLIVSRETTPVEQGYHDEKITVHDLYVPILSSASHVVAVVVLTRMGRVFTPESQMQTMAMANQVALALEKLRHWETSERNRVLNQRILDSIREGIQLFDENGRLIQLNQTLCSWMGIEGTFEWCDGLIAQYEKTLAEKVDQPDELFQFVRQAVNGEISKDTRMIYRLLEEQKVIQVYFEQIFDSQGICRGTVLVHRDMTREYEVDQMKSEFVSTVSHELRTPLSSVLGFTELMLNKELKPERQTKYLMTIHREAKRLTELINDFLDIQRMESGKQTYEFSAVDLLPMLTDLVETLSINSPQHPLRIETELRQAVVRGDETKLRQVFLNIVGNAIKYSPDGGEVTVRLLDRGGELEVAISDQGLGIPKEAIGKLFTKFYRIDNSDRRKIGGTGLGLAICKEIMKAHEGAIDVDSVFGEGSTFRLYFPRNQVVPDRFEGSSVLPTTDDRLRLMIVEDDDSLALLLRDELKEMGFSVMHVREGQQAVEEIQKELPDAIVLDILLADGFNGWQVLDRLKQSENTASIPIFISSALDEKERGLSLGANEYLTKPYQPSKLSNVILQTLLRREKSGVIMIPEPGAEGGEN